MEEEPIEVWEQQITESERQMVRKQRKRRGEEQNRDLEEQFVQIEDLYNLKEKAANLEALTKETVNTKSEIKKGITELLRELARIVTRVKFKMAEHQSNVTTEKSLSDSEVTKGCSKKETRDQVTQTLSTADIVEEFACMELKEKINCANTINEVVKVVKMPWPKRAYCNTRLVKGSILSDKEMRLVIINEKSEKDAQILEKLEPQFSALGSLKGSGGLKPGEVATILRRDDATINGREDSQSGERILLLGKVQNAENPEEMMEAICKITEQVLSLENQGKGPQRDSRWNWYLPHDSDPEIARKILECVLHKKSRTADICLRKGQTRDENDNRRPSRPKVESIFIKNREGETYVDTLKAVKSNTDPEEAGVTVQKIKKTKSGDLVMRVRATEQGGREKFAKQITEKAQLKAEKGRVNRTKILINDLDDVTTTEDIRLALLKVLTNREDAAEVEISEPRPRKYEGQTAILHMRADVAKDLLKKKRIKVGWTYCRMLELVRPACCRICQKFGHQEQECTEEDDRSRGKCCFRCGSSEHLAKMCDKDPKCYICSGDHPANSMACPEYRAKVQAARKVKLSRSRLNPRAEQSKEATERTQTKPLDENKEEEEGKRWTTEATTSQTQTKSGRTLVEKRIKGGKQKDTGDKRVDPKRGPIKDQSK